MTKMRTGRFSGQFPPPRAAHTLRKQPQEGVMSNVQDQMQELLNQLVHDGAERGVQLAVFLGGACVVDAAAGFADVARTKPVTPDTLFPSFSCTKGLMSTLIHQLVERGRLAYDTPIADVWPEFAQNGKAGVLLRHVLDHTSGLHNMPAGLNRMSLENWDEVVAALAAAAPATPVGTTRVYHAVTHGFLLGEVARRVDGRPVGQLVRDEICRPLGITDLYVGLPESEDSRVAELSETFEPGKEPNTADDGVPRPIPNWMFPLHVWMNEKPAWRATVPASNGIMSARALATHYAALVDGGVNGVRLLPETRVRAATHYKSPDVIEEGPPPFGLGYALGRPGSETGTGPHAFGHGGYGGAQAFGDSDRGLAVAYTKNHFSSRGATSLVLAKLREVLGITQT